MVTDLIHNDMSKSNSFETSILGLILQNANIANIGDAAGLRGAAAAGNLHVSLHTADPGEAGNQSTSEANYTGYARVAVVRSAGGWAVANGVGSNAAAINFGQCTAGSNNITHFGIGVASAGATELLYKGALTASLAVSAGITPQFATGALTITED